MPLTDLRNISLTRALRYTTRFGLNEYAHRSSSCSSHPFSGPKASTFTESYRNPLPTPTSLISNTYPSPPRHPFWEDSCARRVARCHNSFHKTCSVIVRSRVAHGTTLKSSMILRQWPNPMSPRTKMVWTKPSPSRHAIFYLMRTLRP